MSYSPDSIRALAAYWVKQGGVNLGIVGDSAHARRASYHNGQDAITRYGRTAANDYSIRYARDREPYLTNAAAALDLGKLDGELSNLYAFSRWLARRCAEGAPGTRDIRELIYSPDGKTVRRWDGYSKTFYTGGTGTGQGDDSHLWHSHIAFPRDSENRDKLALFAPFFEGDDMAIDWYPIRRPTGPLTITEGRGLVNLVTGRASGTTDYVKTSLGGVHLIEPWSDQPGMQDGYLVRHRQQAWVALDGVVEIPPDEAAEVPTEPAPEPTTYRLELDGETVAEGTTGGS